MTFFLLGCVCGAFVMAMLLGNYHHTYQYILVLRSVSKRPKLILGKRYIIVPESEWNARREPSAQVGQPSTSGSWDED